MRGRRPHKIDVNQPALVRQLRGIPGVSVAITSQLGCGFPDLVVGVAGKNLLLEVKDPDNPPSKRALTEDEQNWHEAWRGQVSVVETLDDVLEMMRG